jgi:hypothetical protein
VHWGSPGALFSAVVCSSALNNVHSASVRRTEAAIAAVKTLDADVSLMSGKCAQTRLLATLRGIRWQLLAPV